MSVSSEMSVSTEVGVSDQCDKDFSIEWDPDEICSHIAAGNIVYDKKRLSWQSGYEKLKEFIENTFKQVGKWRLPGGSARKFESEDFKFVVTWYPGKLNSLTFNGKIGEHAKVMLKNLCEATSISMKPISDGWKQTVAHSSMESHISH